MLSRGEERDECGGEGGEECGGEGSGGEWWSVVRGRQVLRRRQVVLAKGNSEFWQKGPPLFHDCIQNTKNTRHSRRDTGPPL